MSYLRVQEIWAGGIMQCGVPKKVESGQRLSAWYLQAPLDVWAGSSCCLWI